MSQIGKILSACLILCDCFSPRILCGDSQPSPRNGKLQLVYMWKGITSVTFSVSEVRGLTSPQAVGRRLMDDRAKTYLNSEIVFSILKSKVIPCVETSSDCTAVPQAETDPAEAVL